jgi:hypothetical protein
MQNIEIYIILLNTYSYILYSGIFVKFDTILIFKKLLEKGFFCSILSEFENFLLCERILINVTTCQNKTSS